MIAFSQPLLLVLLALIPLSVYIALPRLVQRRASRAVTARTRAAGAGRISLNRHALAGLLVRSLLIGAIVLALAGLQIVTLNNRLSVAFLVDVSDSVGGQGRDQALRFVRESLQSMRADGNDRAAVVAFGNEAQVERSLSQLRDVANPSVQVGSSGTNIEAAIRLGLSLLPNDTAKRLVLLSDGKQTVGDADSAARLARATSARLDVVQLPSVEGPDAAIERIDAPQRASVGQTIPLNIVVRSNTSERAQLTVFSGPDVVSQNFVSLNPGMNEFTVRAQATRAGFSAFRVQLTPERDITPQNNALASSVIVGGSPRVLLVAGQAGEGGSTVDETSSLKSALTAAGIEYDEVTPQAMPSEIPSLASYQAVVLVNVPARDLSLRTMFSLQSYVRDIGGGLVAIGGPSSFGVGGYFKTPLEETLPVDMQVRDPKRFPSVSMVVVMDKSGSMSALENGVVKIRLAAEAAARVAELMNDQDELTVIGFDTQPVDVVGPFLGRDRAAFIPRILRIGTGGGGIYVLDSLEQARTIINRTDRQSKFVILLADGNDSERQEGSRELVRAMRAEGTTLTVVSIGDGSDVGFLRDIARLGQGRFHLTTRAANLPTIFTEEAALAQRNYIVEEPFFPSQGVGSPILSGITAVPQLRGYVASTPKPAAQVVLRANESDPLLAKWQYGLGRAVAFTSDATGRWARDWTTWAEFPRFWAQAIRWTILERRDSNIQARVSQRGDQAVIEADVPDTGVDAALSATVLDSEGNTRQIELLQVAPGRYESAIPLGSPGAYFVRITSNVTGTQGADETTISWVRPYSPEYAPTQKGADDLKAWAQLGGGAPLTSPSQAFALNVPAAASRTELFPWLLALAALLLPFDIGIRRIVVSLAKLFGRKAQLKPSLAGASTGSMGQLMRAKTRATTSGGASAAPAAKAQPTIAQTVARERPSAPPAAPPKATPERKTEPPAGGTASELLRRKREKQQGDDAQPPDSAA